MIAPVIVESGRGWSEKGRPNQRGRIAVRIEWIDPIVWFAPVVATRQNRLDHGTRKRSITAPIIRYGTIGGPVNSGRLAGLALILNEEQGVRSACRTA